MLVFRLILSLLCLMLSSIELRKPLRGTSFLHLTLSRNESVWSSDRQSRLKSLARSTRTANRNVFIAARKHLWVASCCIGNSKDSWIPSWLFFCVLHINFKDPSLLFIPLSTPQTPGSPFPLKETPLSLLPPPSKALQIRHPPPSARSKAAPRPGKRNVKESWRIVLSEENFRWEYEGERGGGCE